MTWLACALEVVVGVTGGALTPDADLSHYRWDTSPRATLGAYAGIERGPVEIGLHAWTASTTQDTGLDDVAPPSVRLGAVELAAGWRLFSAAGVGLVALASAGRVHLGYHPDSATFDVGGNDVTVDFDPIDEWIFGGGLAARRAIGHVLMAGARVDYHVFGLETAHRNGDVIERDRESFGNWSGRLELSYRFGIL
jgi:hypothetical protein